MKVKTQDPIVLKNIELLDNRSCVGVMKYGVYLNREDLSLRDFLVHALEETLDKANYLQAAIHKIDNEAIHIPDNNRY